MQEQSEDMLHEAFGASAVKQTFDVERLRSFLINVKTHGLNLAVITSGGTTVSLERTEVRFIDNFSTGTRGALSAECFLTYCRYSTEVNNRLFPGQEDNREYAVIFLSRKESKQPFSHAISVSRFADSCQVTGKTVSVNDSSMANAMRTWANVRDRVFIAHFRTVQEYLANLRLIAILAAPLGRRVLFYLAAAVSDFFIPESMLPHHKIQSADGCLTLQLEKVPKCLGLLRRKWAPGAFIASFKLETDEKILLQKSKHALRLYQMNCVIANKLDTRYKQVKIVCAAGTQELILQDNETSMEAMIVSEIIERHLRFVRGESIPH